MGSLVFIPSVPDLLSSQSHLSETQVRSCHSSAQNSPVAPVSLRVRSLYSGPHGPNLIYPPPPHDTQRLRPPRCPRFQAFALRVASSRIILPLISCNRLSRLCSDAVCLMRSPQTTPSVTANPAPIPDPTLVISYFVYSFLTHGTFHGLIVCLLLPLPHLRRHHSQPQGLSPVWLAHIFPESRTFAIWQSTSRMITG